MKPYKYYKSSKKIKTASYMQAFIIMHLYVFDWKKYFSMENNTIKIEILVKIIGRLRNYKGGFRSLIEISFAEYVFRAAISINLQ